LQEAGVDKTHERLKRWCSAPGISFENSEAEETFKSRTERMADAVLLKTPDRVPNTPTFGIFPALDKGFTCEVVFLDRNKAYTAWMKTLLDLKPDVYRLNIRPGSVWEMIDCKQVSLPGRGISPYTICCNLTKRNMRRGMNSMMRFLRIRLIL
jgi:hypothetical protein